MLLLPTTAATRHRPVPTEDEHGWVTVAADPDPVEYPCNLQLRGGTATVSAVDGGDAGPNAPRVTLAGLCYFNPDADVKAGDRLTIDTVDYHVRYVYRVDDPVSDDATVLVAEVVNP